MSRSNWIIWKSAYSWSFYIYSYIYRRLQFLGSKSLSQAVTLSYLAMWHGLASGYYMNFFLEFIMVNTENQVIFIKKKKCDEIFVIVKKVLKIILGVSNTVKLHYYSNILSIVKCKLYDPDSFLYDEWMGPILKVCYFTTVGNCVYRIFCLFCCQDK